MTKFIQKIKDCVGFGLGLFLVFFFIVSVYAIVEPKIGPSNNYVLDWSFPLHSMHNSTYEALSQLLVTVNEINQTASSQLQTSSGSSISSFISANLGQYGNRIPDRTFPFAYTEVCFKNGNTLSDRHLGANESTSGGSCVSGDVGYVIEVNERSISGDTTWRWTGAKEFCLRDGMRLPEPLSFSYLVLVLLFLVCLL